MLSFLLILPTKDLRFFSGDVDDLLAGLEYLGMGGLSTCELSGYLYFGCGLSGYLLWGCGLSGYVC